VEEEWDALALGLGFERRSSTFFGLEFRRWERARDGIVATLTPDQPTTEGAALCTLAVQLAPPLRLGLLATRTAPPDAPQHDTAVDPTRRRPVAAALPPPWRVEARDVASARELVALLAPVLEALPHPVTLTDESVARSLDGPPEPAALEQAIAELQELALDVTTARAAVGPAQWERDLVGSWRALEADGWALDEDALRLETDRPEGVVTVEAEAGPAGVLTTVCERGASRAAGAVSVSRARFPSQVAAILGLPPATPTGDAVFDRAFEARGADARRLLGADVRTALLTLPDEVRQVDVDGRTTRLHVDGPVRVEGLDQILAVLDQIRGPLRAPPAEGVADGLAGVNMVGSLVALALLALGMALLLS
jgi:hypothetical protein